MDYLKAGVYADQDSLLDLRYDYDAVGNLLSILDVPNSNQKQCFTYDANNRLLTAKVGINDATCSGTVGNGEYADQTYSYSTSTGNLSSKTGLGTYTYDSTQPHAVDAVTGFTYLYDLNGNMTTRIVGTSTYTLGYDYENQLTSVSGAASATFVYDGDGNRVKATVGGTTTAYIGNIFEWTGSTSTMKKYYYAGATRVAVRTGTGTGTSELSFLFGDHLGSTSVSADSAGTKTSAMRYKAWGEDRYTSGSAPTSFRFTGQTLWTVTLTSTGLTQDGTTNR